MFAKGDRFSGNQLKSIADQKTVKMAGIWAASDQMGIVNKLDLAAFVQITCKESPFGDRAESAEPKTSPVFRYSRMVWRPSRCVRMMAASPSRR